MKIVSIVAVTVLVLSMPRTYLRAETPAKPLFVALIGGFDSDPTAEQIADKAPRGVGNSGLFQLAGDLRKDGIRAEYFNWNGNAAGKLNEQPLPLSKGIAERLRKQHQEHPSDRLAIVGNSWGGHTAWEVCQLLADEPAWPIDLAVFLDPSSVGRFDKSQPEKLPSNIRRAVTIATRNALGWKKWANEPRAEFIDLGDPVNGFLKKPGPAYDSLFDVKAHIAAEWDDAIHKDIRARLLSLANKQNSTESGEPEGVSPRTTATGANVRGLTPPGSPSPRVAQPNILWFVVDDMSANFSCYGEKLIETPHVDRLAREGTRFSRAFTTAPVCSPCRSAMITGMYQTSIGAHHHRSGRGVEKISLPAGVVPVPELFQKAGYFTCIGDGLPNTGKKNERGKTDYNFEWNPKMYDGGDWSGRKPDQPFFMQVQLAGGKLRGGTRESARKLAERARKEFGAATDPNGVTLPPYYPRDPVLLEDWAAYLDAVRFTDLHVGKVLARLEEEKLLDQTLVIFMTDHGISHARGKQFLYDEGTHIPFIIRGPGIPKGVVRDDFVQQIDMAPTSLAAAGIEVLRTMQGRDVFSSSKPRDSIFAARDRCDETVEHLRSVRTDRWLYIRNVLPQRPHLQPNRYKDGKSIVQSLRSLHAAGQLSELQERLLFTPTRPSEELYEWTTDRFQTRSLAADPAHAATLAELRGRLDHWMTSTNDLGRQPESDKMYDSDMAEYVGRGDKKDAVLLRNIELMKQWAKDGK